MKRPSLAFALDARVFRSRDQGRLAHGRGNSCTRFFAAARRLIEQQAS